MHFLDPVNDFAFKKIFGNENKKHILISFLNNILHLPMDAQITEVILLDPHQAPHLPGAKETILDVRCHDQKGACYIVEMQVLPQSFFDQRVLYYASKAYVNQLDKGQDYNHLKPVIFLGILNFTFTDNSHYLSTHVIQNIETQEHILRDFRFTFAELPKFNKTEEQLVTVEDKWLYFLKYAKKLKSVPSIIHEAALKEAFEILNHLNWSKEELEYYDLRGIYIQDEIQRVNYGYTRGLTKGIEKGRQEGQTAFLEILLTQRFGPLSDFYQQLLNQASPEQLLAWSKKVLKAKTLEEVFKY